MSGISESSVNAEFDDEMRESDTAAKQRMKQHADSHNHARQRELAVGDTLLVRQQARNKFSSYYEPNPFVITDIRGTMITAQRDDGRSTTRNISHFKRVTPDIGDASRQVREETDDDCENDDEIWLSPPAVVPRQPTPPAPPDDVADRDRRYPARQNRHQPARLNEYVVG